MKNILICLFLAALLLPGCSTAPARSEETAQSSSLEQTTQTETAELDAESSAEAGSAADASEVESVVGKDVPFVPTPHGVVEGMLDLAQVGSDDIVYDLGSGDGRIVIAAAERGAKAVGIDLDASLLEQSRENAKAAGVAERTEFRHQDIFDADLSEATVVTMYLLPGINLEMKPKLLSELKPGTRIVSHAFDMDDWEPDQKATVQGKSIYLWTVPGE